MRKSNKEHSIIIGKISKLIFEYQMTMNDGLLTTVLQLY